MRNTSDIRTVQGWGGGGGGVGAGGWRGQGQENMDTHLVFLRSSWLLDTDCSTAVVPGTTSFFDFTVRGLYFFSVIIILLSSSHYLLAPTTNAAHLVDAKRKIQIILGRSQLGSHIMRRPRIYSVPKCYEHPERSTHDELFVSCLFVPMGKT